MAIKNFLQKGTVTQAGVTLIEMLVVVGIIAVVSSVIMFNYSDFSSNVSVRNLSQEIALTIRKSQTYATSVRSIDGTGVVDSSAFGGYGMSFSTSETATDANRANHKRFVLFVEVPPLGQASDGVYSQSTGGVCGRPSTEQECAEVFSINTADRIVAICPDPTSTVTADCTTKGSVDISFRRPSPDARIKFFSESGLEDDSVSRVMIVLQSAKGLQRAVTVWNTGQISVQ